MVIRNEPQDRPRLLVLSHVLPFPPTAGQHQRVFYTLLAARERFHVTFATPANEHDSTLRDQLSALCDEVVLLPSALRRTRASRLFHQGAASIYAAATGLKRSNYALGRVEFHPDRIDALLGTQPFDCVMYEYWHAAASTGVFQRRGIPCVLDMHDVLWKSYAESLKHGPRVFKAWNRWALTRYRASEEHAWSRFDGVVAINREEEQLVREMLDSSARVFYAPMGTDLQRWSYTPEPARPHRIAYYGAFASAKNRASAIRCVTQVMPIVWQKYPLAEIWLVGSNPSDDLRALQHDPRVRVTGFVDDVQNVLRTMTALLCPWEGTWGFRSRLIETMAVGVPAVVSPDAVHGMELSHGLGVLQGRNNAELAAHVLRLIDEPEFQREQSRRARERVEQLFSLENTYGRLITDLAEWLKERRLQRLGHRQMVTSVDAIPGGTADLAREAGVGS